MPEQLLKLPQKPGTVIAIGTWWLVRLRPYGGAQSAWELLPMPDDASSERAKALEVRAQCIYNDEWVLAEAEQEGGYVVISDPRDAPSGVRYFRHEAARATAPERPRPVWDGLSKPPIGARVQRRDGTQKHGEIVAPTTRDDTVVFVKWVAALDRELEQIVNLEPYGVTA